jgi:hypothetical protein
MFEKGKRGGSNIDTVISLSFFLLFVAWFFIFLRPFAEPAGSTDSMISIIENNLEKFSTDIEETLVRIYCERTGEQPMVASMPFEWNESSAAIKDGRYFGIYSGKALFYVMPEKEKALSLIHLENISAPLPDPGINANNLFATEHNFRADFENSALIALSYYNSTLISSVSLYINNVSIMPEKSDFKNTKIAAAYTYSAGSVSGSSFIFDNHPKILSEINAVENSSIHLIFSFSNLDKFYSNNENNGAIEGSRLLFPGKYIDIYSGNESGGSGVSFVFDRDVLFVISPGNPDELEIFSNSSSLKYEIIAHSGDYHSTEGQSGLCSAEFSIRKKLTALSEEKILSEDAYEILESGYTALKNFAVKILCENGKVFEIGKVTELKTDIYAREIPYEVISADGNRTSCKVQISVWQ